MTIPTNLNQVQVGLLITMDIVMVMPMKHEPCKQTSDLIMRGESRPSKLRLIMRYRMFCAASQRWNIGVIHIFYLI